MCRDVETRLKETIGFIRTHRPAVFMPYEFDLIIENLNTWGRITGATTRRTLSLLMSQENSPNRPQDETGRSYRRACILLKCALLEPETKWTAEATYINTNYRTGLDNYYEALVKNCWDHLHNSPGIAGRNLELLKNNTLQFLREYRLVVTGKPEAKVFSYGFYMKDRTYRLDCTGAHNARVIVNAINVPATLYASVKNDLGHIHATLSSIDDACNLMLTTQFTGCCYCFMVNGASLAAAHINPQTGTGITGQHISQQLQVGGGFENGNGGEFKAYGRVDTPGPNVFGYPQNAQQMIILAIKQGGAWHVYAQIDMGQKLDAIKLC